MFHFVFNRDSFHSHYSLKFFPSLVSWKYFFFFQRGFREGDEWGSARVGAEGVSLLVWACVWVTWRLIPAFPLQHSCTHLTFLTFLLLFFFYSVKETILITFNVPWSARFVLCPELKWMSHLSLLSCPFISSPWLPPPAPNSPFTQGQQWQ